MFTKKFFERTSKTTPKIAKANFANSNVPVVNNLGKLGKLNLTHLKDEFDLNSPDFKEIETAAETIFKEISWAAVKDSKSLKMVWPCEHKILNFFTSIFEQRGFTISTETLNNDIHLTMHLPVELPPRVYYSEGGFRYNEWLMMFDDHLHKIYDMKEMKRKSVEEISATKFFNYGDYLQTMQSMEEDPHRLGF